MIRKFQDRVDAATDLNNLVAIMEEITEEIHPSELKIDQAIDLAMLPTFGGTDPQEVSEVWSWDEKNVLVVDSQNRWSIEPRCACGEASFHCQC